MTVPVAGRRERIDLWSQLANLDAIPGEATRRRSSLAPDVVTSEVRLLSAAGGTVAEK
ncbi:hypothetical protein HLY00_4073 [Mycolicibacterium hippocampi]|uniref:Uncharacterized protein n=1 Tax=Mycolicibacterium hippocampi TaxID=659824 RepID=A0A850PSZ6_9MYCO|nr:hypothetical protein [Mycolicibacterium hippocampi]